MKVHFFGVTREDKEHLLQKIEEAALDCEYHFFENPLDKNIPSEQQNADAVVVFVNSVIDRDVLALFPNLSFIATRSTGFDHIDLEAAQEKGVVVSNVPSYGENTVAEYTFALILALSRKVYQSYDQVQETGSFSLEGLCGFDLMGKTIGVIGAGRIGRNVIRIAKGFDMSVLVFDECPDDAFKEKYEVTCLPLPEVLGASDIVTLHVPYNDSTHHLMNKETLHMMKPGSFLINTSRGGVVDTEALVEVLRDNHLGGAALDVLEEEGAIKDELHFIVDKHPNEDVLRNLLANHVLIDHPNVIVTPHNAFNTKEALTRILDMSVDNIKAFIEGNPINVVAPKHN